MDVVQENHERPIGPLAVGDTQGEKHPALGGSPGAVGQLGELVRVEDHAPPTGQ
jgi:hypothetical protein